MCVNKEDENEYAVNIDSDYFSSDYDDVQEQPEEEKESNIVFE